MAEARRAWAAEAPELRREDLVFVDESGVATSVARLYGRAPGGERAGAAVPHGRWERLTILGGLSLDGPVACLAVEGATDNAVMNRGDDRLYQARLGARTAPRPDGDPDNLSVNRAARVRRLIKAAGCQLRFLPPYLPDFNRIEHAWRKLKTLLRGMGARTTEALHTALTTLVDRINGSDARRYFDHCGYAAQ